MTVYIPVKVDLIGTLDDCTAEFTVGKQWSARERAFNEGTRLAHNTDDFLIATVEGGWMTDLTGADGSPLVGWTAEDDYLPVAKALGVALMPEGAK